MEKYSSKKEDLFWEKGKKLLPHRKVEDKLFFHPPFPSSLVLNLLDTKRKSQKQFYKGKLLKSTPPPKNNKKNTLFSLNFLFCRGKIFVSLSKPFLSVFPLERQKKMTQEKDFEEIFSKKGGFGVRGMQRGENFFSPSFSLFSCSKPFSDKKKATNKAI